MAFQVSPGVQVNEIDATSVIPAVSTSIGGFAGAFNWGPVDKPILVSSEDAMATVFSTPTPATAEDFLTAASFLKYGNALKVVRAINDTDASAANKAINASSGATEILIKNDEDFLTKTLTEGTHGMFVARYPGILGNSIEVYIVASQAAFAHADFVSFAPLFGEAPSTSDYAKRVQGVNVNDEVHVVVVDQLGYITGTAGTVLETYEHLSRASDAVDANGSSIYVKSVINKKSEYVYFTAFDADADDASNLSGGGIIDQALTTGDAVTAFTANDNVIDLVLDGGLNGSAPTEADVKSAYDQFTDADIIDVNLLFSSAQYGKAIGEYIIDICEDRKDCMAFISPPVANATTAALAKAFALTIKSTSYGSIDSASVYVYNKYSDEYIWIGASGLCAGLCANTDNLADAWFSPAGVNRGQLRGVSRLSYNPNKAERDMLYKNRVNPLVSFPGQGTMLFGDKTLLSRPSAFDRINVRRLFIVLEKAISTASKAQLFEFNDEFTQAQFRNMIEPFLRDVKGRRGVTDFLVVCDESNNTGQVVDSNSFVADIYIKPARSINFITLNFIATRTGVDFSEVAGG